LIASKGGSPNGVFQVSISGFAAMSTYKESLFRF
jgi:hypothetical protein